MNDSAQRVARYQHLRQVGRGVAHTLVGRLSRDMLDEGAEKLGVLHDGVLVLDDETQLAVMMDFCVHHLRRGGQTAVDTLIAENLYPPGSDEWIILHSLKDAYFSCFLVESREPGVGVRVRDVIRDEDRFIFDMGFSQTAKPGLLFATRLHAPENIVMTTGTALPIGQRPPKSRQDELEPIGMLKSYLGGATTPEQITRAVATVIRVCFDLGASSHVQYADLPGQPPSRPLFSGSSPARSTKPPPGVGRYDPCPCGSGKKFKFCCEAPR